MLPTGRASAQLPSGTRQLLWADEFNLSDLDSMKWNYGDPWGSNMHSHYAYGHSGGAA